MDHRHGTNVYLERLVQHELSCPAQRAKQTQDDREDHRYEDEFTIKAVTVGNRVIVQVRPLLPKHLVNINILRIVKNSPVDEKFVSSVRLVVIRVKRQYKRIDANAVFVGPLTNLE